MSETALTVNGEATAAEVVSVSDLKLDLMSLNEEVDPDSLSDEEGSVTPKMESEGNFVRPNETHRVSVGMSERVKKSLRYDDNPFIILSLEF